MLDTAAEEQYISADVTINGQTVENVGIRPKGNSSLAQLVNSESDRYSFKIKFDEYVKGQTWEGLDKLVLNNMTSDSSYMKEYLSYDIMSYIGVNAPLFSFADIMVNGEKCGFYLAIEDIDSGYLNRVYDGEGELYKPESSEIGGGMGGNRPQGGEQSADAAAQVDAPQNGDVNGDAGSGNAPQNGAAPDSPAPGGGTFPGGGSFPNFGAAPQGDSTANGGATAQDGTAANGGRGGFGGGGMGGGMGASNGVSLQYTDDNTASYSAIFDNAETKADEEDYAQVITALKNLSTGTALETYFDVDSILRYFAAHTIVVNLDSYVSNMGHNYYLYENGGQLNILPWDYNLAFGGFQSGDASGVVNFPIDTPVSGVSMEDRPLLSKLLEVPEYLEKYHGYLQEIVDGYFSNGKFSETVDKIDLLISQYVENDPTAFCTFEQYNAAIVELKKLGELRGQSIAGQLAGTIPSTTEAQKGNASALIDASSVNLSALGTQGGGNRGGGMGGGNMGGNFGGNMGGLQGIDQAVMQSAMQIISGATNGVLTDEQKASLAALGLTDEQITQLLQFQARGGNRPR